MPAKDFHVEDVMLSTRDETTGAILLQVGDVANERIEDVNVPLFQSWGLVVRPSNPTSKTAAAEAVLARSVDSDIAIAGRDLRGAELAGALKEGEACLYAPGSQARVMLKANGGCTMYTTADNTKDGDSVYITCSPSGIKAVGPWGTIQMTSDGIQLGESGGSFIKMAKNEIVLSANKISIAGGCVGIGSSPTVPILGGAAGPAGVGSLTCKVSP